MIINLPVNGVEKNYEEKGVNAFWICDDCYTKNTIKDSVCRKCGEKR